MKRRLLKTLVAVLAIAAAAAGPVRGQNASPDVTLDFTSNTWGIPEGTEGKTAVENSYTSGGYTITLCGNSGNGYYFSLTEPYILLGKQGAYLQLPAFSSAVDSIHVVGTSVASTNVEQNIYVGETAVSTQTTGMKNVTQKYVINEDYRTAGTIYRIKVTSAHNTQIKKVLVYFAQAPAVPHTVRMAEGTEEAANWSIASGNASVTGNQVLENVMSGSQVTATYNGTTKKVKSVKAVKYVAPAATVTIAPTATEAYIEVGSTSALVNAGAANGGTMMYAVTTTNAQPASTADFSATRPTAQGRTPGTYYVWFYAKADADHSDSEIAGPVPVTLAVMTTVTWNSSNVFNSGHWQDELNQWNPDPRTYEGITISFSGEDVSSFYAYGGTGEASLVCYGQGGDSYTFTAPAGKKFCKIEIIDNSSIIFTNYGDWTSDVTNNKIVWSGTAANAVTLGTVNTFANNLNSIVFKLINAQ